MQRIDGFDYPKPDALSEEEYLAIQDAIWNLNKIVAGRTVEPKKAYDSAMELISVFLIKKGDQKC